MNKLQKSAQPGVTEETRSRLVSVAGVVFAEVGYQAATTRRICALAKANAAAVNYHFGDKLGLYAEVLRDAIGDEEERVAKHEFTKLAPQAALRAFVRLMSENLYAGNAPDLYTKFMLHELWQPTPGLAVVVDHIIRPRLMLLCHIVSRLIDRPALDMRTRLCAHSIVAQVLHYAQGGPVLKLLWPEWRMDEAARDIIARHVMEFSLAALPRQRPKSGSSRRKPGR